MLECRLFGAFKKNALFKSAALFAPLFLGPRDFLPGKTVSANQGVNYFADVGKFNFFLRFLFTEAQFLNFF